MFLDYSEYEDRGEFREDAEELLEEEGRVVLGEGYKPQSIGYQIAISYRFEDLKRQIWKDLRHPLKVALESPEQSVRTLETDGILILEKHG